MLSSLRLTNPHPAGALVLLLAVACSRAQTTASHLPAGHAPRDSSLSQAINATLPAGATQVMPPLQVELGPLGKVEVVLYRRTAADTLFRGLVLIPNASGAKGWRTLPLPDEQELAGNFEEITTAVLAAEIGTPDPGRTVQGGANQGLAQTLPPVPGAPAPLTAPTNAAPIARGARPEGLERALVILFYSHQFGQTDSDAFGRVYLYDDGAFRVDRVRSHLLDGVRTAAVARLRLAPAS